MKNLEKKIEYLPPEYNKTFPFHTSTFLREEVLADVSDEYLQLTFYNKRTKHNDGVMFVLIIIFAVGFFALLSDATLGAKIFFLILSVLSFYFLIRQFLAGRRNKRTVLLFDRLDGSISQTLYIGEKTSGKYSVLFEDAIFMKKRFQHKYEDGSIYLDFVAKGSEEGTTICYGDVHRAWSFFVWYMGRNRPLPPGKVFDQYRTKNYERRKSVGFLSPLYRSEIETPDIV